MCLRPSCRVSSTWAVLPRVSTTLKESTLTGPSSSSTPASSRLPRLRGIGPATSAEVGLQHLVRRVHELVGEVAVVGEQQQPLAVGVEPPDVVDPLLHPVAEEVGERGAALLVRHRGDHPARLVHRQVDQADVDLASRSPSTWITAAAGSTLSPSCATRPSTVTRRRKIRSSQARREPTPAAASTFCRRSAPSYTGASGSGYGYRVASASSSTSSGRNGARGGRSSTVFSPSFSRNIVVVR